MMWFEELPERWDVEKISGLFTERQTKVSDTDFAPLSVSKGGIVPQIATVAKSNAGDNRKLVRKGDFVINSRSDRRGSSGVSSYDGSVSLINIVLEPRKEENGRYYHYLLRSHSFIEEYYRNGRGIVADLWTTRYAEMKTIYLPLPPRDEQDQIVRCLDWKVSQINKLISAKRRQIALLQEQKQVLVNVVVTKGLDPKAPMSDSGVKWLGSVPSTWRVVLNHRLFKENSRPYDGKETTVLSLSQKDGLLPYKDMKERSLHTATYDNWKSVKLNDIVLNRFKAHLGVFFAAEIEGIVTFHYGVYEPRMKDINSKYYELLFHHPVYRAIYAGQSNGMTIGLQNLSNMNFYSVYSLLPSSEEQIKIVKYSLEIGGKIDAVIASCERQVALLYEYRTSLISDVVTGNVDVRGVAVPEYEAVEDVTSDENAEDIEEMESE